MIRMNPMHDLVSPPGQVREQGQPVKYLRDMIKKYYDEEKPQDAEKDRSATLPSTSSEKRLQAVLASLAGLARQAELRQGTFDGWWAQELRKIIKESENSS